MDAARAEQVIRSKALSLPEAYEARPWGEPVFKVPGNRVFCFASEGADVARATVKMTAEEREIALVLPWCRVAGYVGRYGWVTGEAVDEHALDAICEWLVESYWLRADARLRALVEQSPDWGGEESA
jgi:hypothetical protein